MRAATLLSELQTAGVIVTATADGNLELDAPRGVLTDAKITALRLHKAEIAGLLSRRCPYCGYRGMRQEKSFKEGLLYVDTLCGACGELIECFVPAKQSDSEGAETAA
jgi:hypothetical protein